MSLDRVFASQPPRLETLEDVELGLAGPLHLPLPTLGQVDISVQTLLAVVVKTGCKKIEQKYIIVETHLNNKGVKKDSDRMELPAQGSTQFSFIKRVKG